MNPTRPDLASHGYRCHGEGQHPDRLMADSVLWQRKVGGIALHVWEHAGSYEVEAYEHDERDARKLLLYSYTAAQIIDRLPEIERRALAAMRAVRIDTQEDTDG